MTRRRLLVLAGALFIFLAHATPVHARGNISASPPAVAVAPGQTVTLALSGMSGNLQALVPSPLVLVRVDSGAGTLTFTGVTVGATIVHVSDGAGETIDIPVAVLPPAGRVPERVALTITGSPASPDFLAARIAAALRSVVEPSLVPGSRLQPSTIMPLPQPLASGFLTTYAVPVNIEPGAGAAAMTGWTAVDVENAALPNVLPVRLAFRDDPERITAAGVLSRTTVDVAHPTRLYYYHQNMRERRRFCVVLSANDSVMTHVQIIDAASGPNIDVMSVGHAVSKAFLAVQPRNEGTVIGIPGGKPVRERDTPVGPGDGIVGALDLRVLDGGPVTATVMAIPLGAEPASFLYGAKLPDDGHARHGTFDLTRFAQRIIAYSAGGRDVAYVYGSRGQTLVNTDPADAGRDYGDYGVLQHVTFDLNNPAPTPATVYLYEKPLGGVVRSSFVVNNIALDIGCVRVPQRYLIARYDLPPHTTSALDVLTMTDGGSNYPLEIGVSAAPPLAATPAMSAADGCFPKPGGAPPATQPGGEPAGH